MTIRTHVPNRMASFFKRLCKISYYCGIPNLWVDEIHSSIIITWFTKAVTASLILLMICEWLSFWTQHNLSKKQALDRLVFCFAHPILFLYHVNIVYYKEDLKSLLYKLSVTLKQVYDDPGVEQAFVKKALMYNVLYCLCIGSAMSFYGFDGVMQIVRSAGTFTTVITVWPLTTDESVPAQIMQIIWYVLWWAFMVRVSTGYFITLSVIIALEHQYRYLYNYFNSLNDIFRSSCIPEDLDWNARVEKYEHALIKGIETHAGTLWCVKQCQRTSGIVFSAQIFINFTVLCLLMLQIVGTDRTSMNAVVIVSTYTAILFSMGFIMWNAGDVSVQASLLPDAIYFSGWHNCPDAGRIKKLLVLALTQSQKPVMLTCFGVFELSYQTFLTMVKFTYSVFSLLY